MEDELAICRASELMSMPVTKKPCDAREMLAFPALQPTSSIWQPGEVNLWMTGSSLMVAGISSPLRQDHGFVWLFILFSKLLLNSIKRGHLIFNPSFAIKNNK